MFRTMMFAVLAMVCCVGCRHTEPVMAPAAIDFNEELAPGTLALRKIPIGEYPDFTHEMLDPAALKRSIAGSLQYLKAPSSEQYYPYLDITHERAVATLVAMDKLVDQQEHAADGGAGFNRAIRERFDVYQSIGARDPGTGQYGGRVLFTGYFTPIYDGSLTRGGGYEYPLYKRPADLVSDPTDGEKASRKTADGQYVPYYTRAEIEGPSRPLAGQELVWLKSRWEAYVITVQGSARIRLTDGKMLEIGYAGLNGYEYVSPGMRMVADGVIEKSKLSAKALGAYFAGHPEALDKYLNLNPRYVFFTERAGGPFGSLNVPVTAMATIATDKSVYPRAMPAFLVCPIPTAGGGTRAFKGFMMDQDRGGAIRAAGRCDIFMGIGPSAEAIAGRQLNEGTLYYVAVRR